MCANIQKERYEEKKLRKNSKLQMKRIRVKSMFLKNSVGYGMIY
jgi:hypothetical protein